MAKSSPFNTVHKQLGANFAQYDGWSLPHDFGCCCDESKAMYENCAAFDLSSFGKITIKGPDSGELIDNLVATNTTELTDNKWIWAMICDENGCLADIVRLGRNKETFTILTLPGKRYNILELINRCAEHPGPCRVQITDITEKTGMLAIYGPSALETIARILPLDIAGIEKAGFVNKSVLMMSITLIRGSWAGIDGLELLCPASVAPMAAAPVAKYRNRHNLTMAGMQSLQTAMIEASLPFSITASEQAGEITPFELGLGGLIDFNKDFTGKNALEKKAETEPPKRLVGLITESNPNAGQDLEIKHNDCKIGWAGEMFDSEIIGGTIGMGIIDKKFADFSDILHLAGKNTGIKAKIMAIPFKKEIAAEIMINRK